MQQNFEMMKMTYTIISKIMEEQKSKTMLEKKQNESMTPSPINVGSTCLFLFREVTGSLGTPFCYLVDLTFDHCSS